MQSRFKIRDLLKICLVIPIVVHSSLGLSAKNRLATCLVRTTTGGITMKKILFTNATVFEGTEEKAFRGEVLVENDVIKKVSHFELKVENKEITERTASKGKDKCLIYDCKGSFLMPGLVNPHCHFTYSDATSVADISSLPVEEHVLITINNLKTYLECGFTSVIGMASAKPRLEVVARNAVNSGAFPGPRVLASTPEYTVTGGLGDDSRFDRHVPSVGLVYDGPEEFRKSIRELVREGVDIVKFNNSGDSFTMGRMAARRNPMTEEEVRAICETTKNLGKRLAAHSHADKGVLQCINHGVEFINHATYASDKTIEKLASVSDRHFVIPAIAARYNTTYEASEWGITTELATQMGNKEELELGCEVMRKMHALGIKILPFGDYGFAWLPIGTDARDLELMEKLFGMKSWEILRAATAYGGEAWAGTRQDIKIGRIKSGYKADILVVQGNPLTDLGLLRKKSMFKVIMKDGVFFKKMKLR